MLDDEANVCSYQHVVGYLCAKVGILDCIDVSGS